MKPASGEALKAKKAVVGTLAGLHRSGRHPTQIVALARSYTVAALHRIAVLGGITDQKLPKISVMDKFGNVVEIDQEVPAATQLKALEMLVDRGYGKAPLAILVGKEDGSGRGETLTIEEKIAAIKAARDQQGRTTDLEASEIVEVEDDEGQPSATAATFDLAVIRAEPRNVTPAPRAASPQDLI